MDIKTLHDWNLTPLQARNLQMELAQKVTITPGPEKIALLAAADMSIRVEQGIGCAVVLLFTYPDLQVVERQVVQDPLPFPYIPGLLSFREAPLLLKAFAKLTRTPDVVMMDGQGIAHPRGLGLASHVGLWLDLPTFGCAKSVLVGKYREPEAEKGSLSDLIYKEKVIGKAVRTKDNVGPVYVSPGHRIDFAASVLITLQSCDGYRIPRPTRLADRYAAEVKKDLPSFSYAAQPQS